MCRVKAYPKLTNQVDIGRTLTESFHKGASTRLGNLTEVIDEFVASHPDTAIFNNNSVIVRVCFDFDFGFDAGVFAFGCNRKESLLVAGISSIRYELSQKDVLLSEYKELMIRSMTRPTSLCKQDEKETEDPELRFL